MVFQQRNGRVDRYGQDRTPEIVYLVTESANETIRGDMRILEVLEAKDEQGYRNIGDPSAFMNVHDILAEEEITRQAIAEGEPAQRFDARLQPAAVEGDDLLALFLGTGGAAVEPTAGNEDLPPRPRSLFVSELAYCAAALHRLREKERDLRFEVDTESSTLTLDAPEDLRHRFDSFPREVIPNDGRFVLTEDLRRMQEAIADGRRDEAAWPRLHYLWRLCPVVGWLNDRMLAAFGRHEAPVLAGVPGLAPEETVYVLSGLVPNRKSHPLVYEWVGVAFRGDRLAALIPFEDLLERTGLGSAHVANRLRPVDIAALEALLPAAVEHARRWVVERRNAFEEAIDVKLEATLAELEWLKDRQLRQVEIRREQSQQAETLKLRRAEQQRRAIELVFDEYLEWVQDTMTTERQPWIKVVCVLAGGD